MPHIDDFIQFVAEELMTEGNYSLILDAPESTETFWLAGTWKDGKEYLIHGTELEDVLNDLCIGLDFTSKEMPVMQYSPNSSILGAAYASTRMGKSLKITAPHNSSDWVIEVEGSEFKVQGADLKMIAGWLDDRLTQHILGNMLSN